MTTIEEHICIQAGPSTSEIVDALKYAFDKDRNFRVSFTLTHERATNGVNQTISRGKVSAQIIGVTFESGSSDFLIVTANLSGGLGTREFFYNARTRKGYAVIVP